MSSHAGSDRVRPARLPVFPASRADVRHLPCRTSVLTAFAGDLGAAVPTAAAGPPATFTLNALRPPASAPRASGGSLATPERSRMDALARRDSKRLFSAHSLSFSPSYQKRWHWRRKRRARAKHPRPRNPRGPFRHARATTAGRPARKKGGQPCTQLGLRGKEAQSGTF